MGELQRPRDPVRRGANDDLWKQHFADVAGFHAEHGRLPKLPGDGPLGKWVYVQRYARRSGRLAEWRAAALDEALPGWDETREVRWERRLAEVTAFVAEHGRRPSKRAAGHERDLGMWLDGQFGNHGAAHQHPALEARIRAVLPERRFSRRDRGRATMPERQ